MSTPSCKADACRQGRIECPAPHACRLSEEAEHCEPATTAETVAVLVFPAVATVVVVSLLIWLFTR